jgi:hypothetical protein
MHSFYAEAVAGFIEVLILTGKASSSGGVRDASICEIGERKRVASQIVFGLLKVSYLTPCEAKAERPFIKSPRPFHVSDRIPGEGEGFDHDGSHGTR